MPRHLPTNARARVAVATPFWGGHHASWTERIAARLAQEHDVVVACPTPGELGSPSVAYAPRLSLGPGRARQAVRTVQAWRALGRALDSVGGADLVLNLYADAFTARLVPGELARAALGRPFVALLFQASWLDDADERARHGARHRSLTAARGVGFLDESRIEALARALPGVDVVHIPDGLEPCDEIDDGFLASIQARARGRPIVSLVGTLSDRKGLIELARLAPARRDLFFVVQGELAGETIPLEDRPSVRGLQGLENAWFANRRLSDAELNAALTASAVAWLWYRRHRASSGLLARAAALGVPVVVADDAPLRERVRGFDLGRVASTESAIGPALDAAIERGAPGAARYASVHNPKSTLDAVAALVNRALR